MSNYYNVSFEYYISESINACHVSFVATGLNNIMSTSSYRYVLFNVAAPLNCSKVFFGRFVYITENERARINNVKKVTS